MRHGIFALALALAVASARRPRWFELSDSYSYDQYLRDFGKPAPTGDERTLRAELFSSRLQAALEHNAGPSSWRRGLNHMSDWTDAERKRVRGYRYRGENRAGQEFMPTADASSLPTSVDWRTKGVVTPVKDQGHCGSCWAFASTAVIESHLAIDTGILAELSPQELVSCAPNYNDCGGFGGCDGSIAELAYQYVQENGLASPYSFPYVSWLGDTNGSCAVSPPTRLTPVANLTGFVKLPANNDVAIAQAVATVGPLAVNVAAEPWSDYESGVFDGCATSGIGTDIDHVVVLVGYDSESWIIRNSWTPLWGESGYIRLKRTTACGTDQAPQDGTGCNGGPSTVQVCGMCGVLYDASFPTGVRFAK
jgi:cathepsin L